MHAFGLGRRSTGHPHCVFAYSHTQVSYADVFTIMQRIVEGPPHKLLESVAHRVATSIMQAHAPVHAVRVSISKTHIPAQSAAVQSVGKSSPWGCSTRFPHSHVFTALVYWHALLHALASRPVMPSVAALMQDARVLVLCSVSLACAQA